ncbi:hypothetical protein KQI82_02625 [Oscillibacter sp. MSJ-2]|uniref:RND related barrel-sandwich hybrid domain-containing protein n=1 Tax=Dysosmobacter acutus TaxID=2841504 RepID=A0ABS6F6E1_9FIRM|nr:HlyD family efflux transporter periplasmic adaptor subunit [Dysosmobacter acutus]MBU5625830.1 hypothetical protein [Dysosmobacter acutus]
MKSGVTKGILTVLMLCILAYFGIQIGGYFSDPLSTVTAYQYQVEDAVTVTGYVVRQEEVLSDGGAGVLDLRRSEGEKVGAGQTLAVVYKDQSTLDARDQIEALTARLEQLQYAQDASLSSEVSLRLDSDILSRITKLHTTLSEDKLTSADSVLSDLRSLILKRDYTYTDAADLSGEIASVQGQIQSLRSSASAATTVIAAKSSGVYSAVVDGYETVLVPDALKTMTAKEFRAIGRDGAVSSRVGKLIYGDTWYFVTLLRQSDAESLASSTTLRFAKGIDTPFRVKVESVSEPEDGRCVVVFSTNKYLSEVTLLRQQSADVVRSSYDGLRVPRNAVRVDESGQSGVYCRVGVTARFKPVEVTYTGEDFCLIRGTSDEDKRRLRTGDQVILSAGELYDGKIVGN